MATRRLGTGPERRGRDKIGRPGSSHHCRNHRGKRITITENAPPWPKQGPASYFPSIEKKYGRSIAEWQQIIAGSGLDNALAGWTLAGNVAQP